MIAFIDLETTGLDEHKDPIIEWGIVMVNETTLEAAGELAVVVAPPSLDDLNINSHVLDMHMRNGLWDDIHKNGVLVEEAREIIIEFLKSHSTGKRKQHILAGSGVSHFDNRFIKAQYPEVAALLTFWSYDVGVLRRAFESAGRKDLLGKPPKKNHRASDDARLHYEEWKLLTGLLKQITVPA